MVWALRKRYEVTSHNWPVTNKALFHLGTSTRDPSASALLKKRPRMNTVIVFLAHDSCLSPNKDTQLSLAATAQLPVLWQCAYLQSWPHHRRHHGFGVDLCPPYSLLFFQIHKPCCQDRPASSIKSTKGPSGELRCKLSWNTHFQELYVWKWYDQIF